MAQPTPDKAYLAKQASLKNFLPFLESMVKTLKDDPGQEKQLFKIRSIKKIIEGSKNVTIDQLYLLEKIIHTLYEQKTKKDPKELAEQVKTQDPTLSSTTTTTTPPAAKMIPTREEPFRPAILKHRTISPASNGQRNLPSTSSSKPRYDNRETRYDSRHSTGSHRRHSPLTTDRRSDPKSASSRLGAIIPAIKPDLNLVITRRTESSDSLIRSVAISTAPKRYDDRGRDQNRSWSREARSHSGSRERSYSSERVSPNSSRHSNSSKVTSTVTKPNRGVVSYDEIESPDSPEMSEPTSTGKPIIIPTERTSSEYLLKKLEDVSDDEDISKTTYEKRAVAKPNSILVPPATDKVKFRVLTPSTLITVPPPTLPEASDKNDFITIAQTTIKKIHQDPPKPQPAESPVAEKPSQQLFTRRSRFEKEAPANTMSPNLITVPIDFAIPETASVQLTTPVPVPAPAPKSTEPIDMLKSPPLSNDDINTLMRETGCKEKVLTLPPAGQPRRSDPRLNAETERLALKYRPHKRLSSESPGQMSPPVMNVPPKNTSAPFMHKDPRILTKSLYPPPALLDMSIPPPSMSKPPPGNLTYKQYKEQKAAQEEQAARLIAASTGFKTVNDDKTERLKYEQSKKNKEPVAKPAAKAAATTAKPDVLAAKKPVVVTEQKKSQFDKLYRAKNIAQAPPLGATPANMQKFKIPKLNKKQDDTDGTKPSEEVVDEEPEAEPEPVVEPVAKAKARIARIRSSSDEDEKMEEVATVEEPVTRPKRVRKAPPKVDETQAAKRMSSRRKSVAVKPMSDEEEPEMEEPVAKRTSLRRKSVAVKPISDDDEPEVVEPVAKKTYSRRKSVAVKPISEDDEPEGVEPVAKKTYSRRKSVAVRQISDDDEPEIVAPVAKKANLRRKSVAFRQIPDDEISEPAKEMKKICEPEPKPKPEPKADPELKPTPTALATPQPVFSMEEMFKLMQSYAAATKVASSQGTIETKDILNILKPLLTEDKFEAVEKIVCEKTKSDEQATTAAEPSTSTKKPEESVAPLQPPPATTTAKRARKSKGKTELERLNDDLEDFLKHSTTMSLTGRRACTLKDVESPSTSALVSPIRSSTKAVSRESSVETSTPAVNKPGPLSSKRKIRQPSPKALADKQLKVVLEKVAVPATAEGEKKQTKKSRRRKRAWAAGVIRRRVGKAASPAVGVENQESGDDDVDDDDGNEEVDVEIEDEVPSLKNNDPDNHIRKLKTVMKKCLLCEHDTGTMVSHYVRQHPKSEVYVSRVTQRVAANIMEAPVAVFGKLVTDDVGLKRVQGPCRICNYDSEKTKADWVLHLTSHTGEYRYRCVNCTLRCRFANAWKNDYHDDTCKGSKIVESIVIDFIGNQLYAYICSKCHYVQGKREHIEKHIRNQHKGEEDMNSIEAVEFSVINYPKKKKVKEVKKLEDAAVEEEDMPALNSETNTPIKEQTIESESPIRAMNLQLPPPEPQLDGPKISVVNEKLNETDQLGEDKTKINLVQVRDQTEDGEEDEETDDYDPLDDDTLWEDVETDGEAGDDASDMEIDEKPFVAANDPKPKPSVVTSPAKSVKSPSKAVAKANDKVIRHNEETIRNHAKRINTCGFAEIDDTFYFICRIDCLTFFTDRVSFQKHIDSHHATATWNGYCYVCECQVLEDEESPIDKQTRHMLTVHVKNRDMKDTVSGSPKQPAVRPKISFRRLSGDVLSSLVQTRVEKSPGDMLVVHSLEPIATSAPAAVAPATDPDLMNLTPWLKNSPSIKRKEYCQNMLLAKNLYCLYKCMDERCCFSTQNHFKFLSHLKNHEQATTLKGPAALVVKNYLKCAYCDDENSARSCPNDLATHIQQSHGTSIFQCPYCFYRSTAAYNVVQHRDQYHADKMLSVLVCDGPQTLLSNELNEILANRSKHVLALSCTECPEKLYVVETFMAHLNEHPGPFTNCQVCHLSCFKKDIAKHLLTHHIGLYECVYCMYGTNNIANIRMHMGNIHPNKLLYVCVRLYKSNEKNVSQNAIESTVLAHIGIKVDMRNFEKCPFTFDELNHKTPDLLSNTDLSMMKRLTAIRNSNNSIIKITNVSSAADRPPKAPTESFDTNESLPGVLSLSELEQNCASSSSFDEPSESASQLFPRVPPATSPPKVKITTKVGNIETPLSSLHALQARVNQKHAEMSNQPTAPSKQNELNVYIQPVSSSGATSSGATSSGATSSGATSSGASTVVTAKPSMAAVAAKPRAYGKGTVKMVVAELPSKTTTPPPLVFQMPVISSVTTLSKKPEAGKIVATVEAPPPPDFTMPQISNVKSLHGSTLPSTDWSQDTSQPIMITNVQSLSREQLLPEKEEKEASSKAETSKTPTPPPAIFPTISSVCSLNAKSTAPLIMAGISVTKPADPVPDITTIEPIIEPPKTKTPPLVTAIPPLPKVVGVESLSTASVSVSVVEKLQLEPAEQKEIDCIAQAIVSDSGLDSEHLYKCGFKNCNTVSKDVQMFQLHQLRHNQATSKQGEWRCAHCSERSKNIVALKNHIKLHGRKRFFCLFCDYKHSLSHFVTTHLSEVHRVTHTRQYPLNPTKMDQNKDIFLMGPQNMTLSMFKQFCINFKKIYEHRRREEINKEKIHYAPDESDLLPTQPIFAQTLFCTDCGYSSKVRTNMLRHLIQHTKDSNTVSKIDPVNPVPCLEVGEKHFDKMWNFSASSVEAVGGSLSALIASTTASPVKGADGGGNLPKFVPEQKRFVCGARNCAYLTIDEPMFSSHIKTLHEQEQNYQCPHCQQVVSPGSLVINKILFHLKLHDSKLYKCTKCDHLHYHKNLMEKHMAEAHPKQSVAMQVIRDASGTASPNVAASVASASSTSSSSSVAAIVMWKCEICKLKTPTRQEIEAHLKIIHSYSFRYRCGLCKYTSSQKKSFPAHFNKRHPDKSVAVVTRYNKCQEADELDTTPLWSRNTSKTKHIRGILFDEEDAAKSTTVEEDPISISEADEEDDEGEQGESADDKNDKSYRPSRSKPVRKRRATIKRNSVTAFEEQEIAVPPHKKSNMSDDPLALPATESAVLDPNVCKPFSCGYKDCKFSDDSVHLIKVHYGVAHNSNQFSIIRNEISSATATFADQPTPHVMSVRHAHVDDDEDDDESIEKFLRYCCDHCEFNFMTHDEVERHWRETHHQVQPDSVFQFRVAKLVNCYHCHRAGTIEEIKKHSLHTHVMQDFACVDSMNPIKCGECEFEASFNRSDVFEHFKTVHNKQHWTSNGRAYDHISQSFINRLLDGGDCFSVTYRCELCRMESYDSDTVIQHLLRKHLIRFSCLHCDEEFKYLTLLRLHQRDQHGIDHVLQLYRKTNVKTAIACLYQNVLMVFSNGLTISAGEVRNTNLRMLRLTNIVEEFIENEYIENNFYNSTEEEPYSFYNQPQEVVDLSQITVHESATSEPVTFADYFMSKNMLPRLLLKKVDE